MNFMSAFRLLTHFSLTCLLLILASVHCTSKSKTPRKVEKSKPQVMKSRQEKKAKTPSADSAATPKPSNEDAVVATPKEQKEVAAALGPAPVKSNRKMNKKTETMTTELGLDRTQETQHLPAATLTLTVCSTQEDDPSALAAASTAKPAKPKQIVEEFFEDQNDDDTLACVKSIEN